MGGVQGGFKDDGTLQDCEFTHGITCNFKTAPCYVFQDCALPSNPCTFSLLREYAAFMHGAAAKALVTSAAAAGLQQHACRLPSSFLGRK